LEAGSGRALSKNSLLRPTNSLFLKIFSLLVRLGNCSRSGCGTGASCVEISPKRPKIAEFPVKFPVSREFGWRLVRIPLRRQPTSPAPADLAPGNLFGYLPESLFQPLSGPKKHVYARLLMRLYERVYSARIP
jgi:hypothetical protein